MPYGAAPSGHDYRAKDKSARSTNGVSSYRQSQYQAHKSAVKWHEHFRHYLKHHAQSLIQALMQQLRSPFSSLLTYGVIAIALTLPTGLYLIADSVKSMNQQWNESAQISLFSKKSVSLPKIQGLADRLRKHPLVAHVKLMTSKQALAEYKEIYKGRNTLQLLGEKNPFPSILIISLNAALANPESIEKFANKLQQHGETQTILLDTLMVKRLSKLIEIVNRTVLVLVIIFAVGIFLIVGNTIRLEILNRKDEIIVTKLIGANNGYIRRPLLYSGLWYGVIGGIFACIITIISTVYLKTPIAEFSQLSEARFQLSILDANAILIIIALGASLGWLGSWMASYRHLRQIEPT